MNGHLNWPEALAIVASFGFFAVFLLGQWPRLFNVTIHKHYEQKCECEGECKKSKGEN